MESYINLDKNMIANTTIGDVEVEWHDVRNVPFELYGLYEPKISPVFWRIPHDVAASVNEKIDKISQESTGGRVRFSTDSPFVAIRARFLTVGKTQHMPLISSGGFDMYIDGDFGSRYVKEFRMPYNVKDYYEQIINLSDESLRSYTINFPIRSVVETLEIGLKPNSKICAPKPYRDMAPMIFYGSSIVHGTGTTHPGLAYPAMISRELNMDFVNMGFAGNAKGEETLAEWLAERPMSVFVCDYDHNTPSTEHLKDTHHRFYEIIREKNPDVPYIMVTAPDYWPRFNSWDSLLRHRDVIMESYLKARAKGDKNVYFIDGMSFNVAPHQYELTVDSIHPNDAGYIRMADSIGSVIKHTLEKNA